MKRVAQNPYHLWAHQSQPDARNAGGTMSFQGTRAYSYAARIGLIETDTKGNRVYLVSNRRYSTTTSQHQKNLKRSIPPGETVLKVWQPGGYHAENVRQLLLTVATESAKAKRAQSQWSQERATSEAEAALETARGYVKAFGLKGPEYKLPKSIGITAKDRERMADRAARYHVASGAREADRAERRRLEHEQWTLEYPAKVALWRERKLVGQLNHMDGWSLMRLSANGANVETSRGATVPAHIVRRAMPNVLPLVVAGRAARLDVMLGAYRATAIEPGGNLIVGCHRFRKDEVIRLAQTLEVM